jgi:rfaE bifunctional protein kinase chain/domain
VHPGHLRYLRYAKSLGEVLVVSVSADDVIEKGVDRPHVHEQLRLENLAALEFVDYVCLDHSEWAGPVLDAVRPDIYVKGREYETRGDARFARERDLVESYGGKVVFSSGDVVFSSTELVTRHGSQFRLEQDKIRGFCERHAINRSELDGLLRSFRDLKILVLGDPILDQYIYCEEANVASEGPILQVVPVEQESFAGGGALMALQGSALGASMTFLTTSKEDPNSIRLLDLLRDGYVDVQHVTADERPVYVKTRYLVGEQKVFKVSSGVHSPLSTLATNQLVSRLKSLIPEHDAVVVTDFGYGMFGEKVVGSIVELCRTHDKPYYADVSTNGHANIMKFRSPRLTAPTESELRFAMGDRESGLSHLASRYLRTTDAESLVLTLQKRGSVVFWPGSEEGERLRTDYLPALRTLAVESVGAGDLFLTGLMMTDLASGSIPMGMFLGSALAATKVMQLGNAPVDMRDLWGFLAQRDELG